MLAYGTPLFAAMVQMTDSFGGTGPVEGQQRSQGTDAVVDRVMNDWMPISQPHTAGRLTCRSVVGD